MIEWIVSATLLILLVLALRALFRKRISLRLRYALWALVLLRLLIPVSLGAVVGVGSLTRRVVDTETAQTLALMLKTELPRMSYGAARDEVAREYAAEGVDIAVLSAAEYERVDYEILARMGGGLSPLDLLKAVWLIGAAAVALALFVSNFVFARRLRRTRRALPDTGCPLRVYLSPVVETPCLFGLFRPAIYVTPQAVEDGAALRHVLEHEMTHYRHGDHVWSLLRGIALALHWYNPLVWRAATLSRQDAELACDEATLDRIGEGERAAYGRTLIAMSCTKRARSLRIATTMTGSANLLRERIVHIARGQRTTRRMFALVLLLALLATGCTFAAGGQRTPDAPAQESAAAGETLRFTFGALCVDVSGVREVKQGRATEGDESWTYDVYVLEPGATLTVVNADTYTDEEGARRANWKIETASGEIEARIALVDDMEPLEITPELLGIFGEGGYVLGFEMAD